MLEHSRCGSASTEVRCWAKILGQKLLGLNQQAVDDALVALSRAAETDANLMLPLIDTVRTRATVGEIMNTLADVFGRYQEKPFI